MSIQFILDDSLKDAIECNTQRLKIAIRQVEQYTCRNYDLYTCLNKIRLIRKKTNTLLHTSDDKMYAELVADITKRKSLLRQDILRLFPAGIKGLEALG